MKEGCKWTSNHDCRLCGVDCKVRESEFNPKQAIEECKISPSREKDEIDDWLEKECHIFMVSCSSIEELRYSVAREVAEKLWKKNWISVEDELPKEDGVYFTLVNNKVPQISTFLSNVEPHWGRYDKVITHWMPIPKLEDK